MREKKWYFIEGDFPEIPIGDKDIMKDTQVRVAGTTKTGIMFPADKGDLVKMKLPRKFRHYSSAIATGQPNIYYFPPDMNVNVKNIDYEEENKVIIGEIVKKFAVFNTSIVWHPIGDHEKAVPINDGRMHIWNLSAPAERKIEKYAKANELLDLKGYKYDKQDDFLVVEGIPPVYLADEEGVLLGEISGKDDLNIFVYLDLISLYDSLPLSEWRGLLDKIVEAAAYNKENNITEKDTSKTRKEKIIKKMQTIATESLSRRISEASRRQKAQKSEYENLCQRMVSLGRVINEAEEILANTFRAEQELRVKAEKELTRILADPRIQELDIVGKSIVMKTEPVIDYKRETYKFGTITCVIDTFKKIISFSSTKLCNDGYCMHVYINNSGEPCWGNTKKFIKKNLDDENYPALILLIIEWLWTYDDDNPRCKIENWR